MKRGGMKEGKVGERKRREGVGSKKERGREGRAEDGRLKMGGEEGKEWEERRERGRRGESGKEKLL